MGSMRVWKKRVWESKNLEKNRKNQKKQKKQFCMDLPKILLTELFFLFFLFFLVFFEFLDKWAWESKKPREKPKKTKKPILHGLTQDSSHRICFFGFFGFFVFFGFLRVFGQVGLGEQKSLRKTKKTKKKQFCMDLPKILLTGLFWKAGNGKKGKKQNMQKPNAPSVCFCFRNGRVPATEVQMLLWSRDCFKARWVLKNQRVQSVKWVNCQQKQIKGIVFLQTAFTGPLKFLPQMKRFSLTNETCQPEKKTEKEHVALRTDRRSSTHQKPHRPRHPVSYRRWGWRQARRSSEPGIPMGR